MKKINVLELKNQSAVTTDIEILQNTISRMCTYSMNVKTYSGVIYTLIMTILVHTSCIEKYWWLGIVVAVANAILDAYYLSYEKVYVTKYNSFIKNLKSGILQVETLYEMNPKNTELKNELLAVFFSALASFSIWGYYLIYIFLSLVLGGIIL